MVAIGHRPGRVLVVHTLRVEHLTSPTQTDVEHAAAVALAIFVRAPATPPGWREQRRPSLLATAVQIAIDLVDQATRDRDVDRRAEQHQDGAQDEHAPRDEAPADAREQPVHALIVYPTPRTVRISGRLNPRSILSRK